MEKQLNTLSNIELLSRFIGMLMDSRSFYLFRDMSILDVF